MKTEHFNQLSEEQLELLAILSEECGEVVQMVGKVLRHGLDHDYKDKGPNRKLLQQECADVVISIVRLVQAKVFDWETLDNATKKKINKNGHLHHAGPLTEEFINALAP